MPRSCDDCGHMLPINVTTLHFPENVVQTIDDQSGEIQLEGGPYERSTKLTVLINDTYLPDGIYRREFRDHLDKFNLNEHFLCVFLTHKITCLTNRQVTPII